MELPGALTTFGPEAGTHLFTEPNGDTVPIQVMLIPLTADEDPVRAAAEHAAARERWRAALAAGDAAPDADPWPLRPVVRIYGQGSATVDLRSGLVVVSVQPGGPAEKAGALIGDILVAFHGKPVADTDDVQAMLDPERVGKPLAATVIRGGEVAALTVTVGERPQREE